MDDTQASRPNWYDSSFPELRSGPPWVMAEMIQAEPDLVPAFTGAQADAERIAGLMLDAAENREPIVITGCGTSEHGALAVRELIESALLARGISAPRVETRQALEAALDPYPAGVLVGVSHEGGTRPTVLALERARAAGAHTAVITAQVRSPVVATADVVLVTPQVDRSWCHTLAYMSAILAGGCIASSITGDDFPAASLTRYLHRALGLSAPARDAASVMSNASEVRVCGLRADRASARELALKIEEGARLRARMHELETLLHGHLAACDRDTVLILIATDPRLDTRALNRLKQAALAAQRIGMPVVAVLSDALAVDLPEAFTPAGRMVLPADERDQSLLAALAASAIALQVLTLEMAHCRGTNPDLIRREETPYREAAAVAESDVAW